MFSNYKYTIRIKEAELKFKRRIDVRLQVKFREHAFSIISQVKSHKHYLFPKKQPEKLKNV